MKEVIKVLLNVWFKEILKTSTGVLSRILRKFSRTRSKTTIVSFNEYPITASKAANIVKSKLKRVIEKNPSVIMTS